MQVHESAAVRVPTDPLRHGNVLHVSEDAKPKYKCK